MQIARVRVRNFRSLADVEIEFSDYTSFIGPNGAGKSSVLYAIAWFFGERPTNPADLRIGSPENWFSVEITFNKLSERDRELLGTYACSEEPCFKRTADFDTSSDVWVGHQWLWSDGQSVLTSVTAAEQIAAYDALRQTYKDLPELRPRTGKRAKELASEFSSRQQTPKSAVEVSIGSMFAPGGAGRELVDVIFIEGAADLATEMDGTGKKTILHEMTSRLVDSNRRQAVNEWKEEHLAQVAELESRTTRAVQESLVWHQTVISDSLARYVPGASVEFEAGQINPTLDVTIRVAPKIRWQGRNPERIGSQGHGTQRALMMAMVESLARSRREGREEQGPVLLLLVEEPEIYQHPTRARHFANQLFKIATDSGFQVIVATHSQHFVSEEFLESLRLVRHSPSGSRFHTASVKSLADSIENAPARLRKALMTEMPKGLAEGFFADAVLLVEGITDKVILEALAESDGYPMDEYGIVVVDCGTKTRVPMFTRLFEQFGIPTFFVIDGDYSEPSDTDSQKKREARRDHRSQTEDCVRLLEIVNPSTATPYAFGDQTLLTDRYAVFCQGLEAELTPWNSFHEAMKTCNPTGEKKNPYHYRAAATEADLLDSPECLRQILASVRKLADENLRVL